LDLLPGDAQLKKQAAANAPDDKQLKRMEAILLSMTPKERHFPQLLDGARKKRIARGSGTRPEDINNLLKQYDMMRKMMKRGPLVMKLPNMPSGFRGMPGMR
jgi:signal recognition particle subunit SRP54